MSSDDDEDRLRKLGSEISRQVAALREARKPAPRPHGGGWHKGVLAKPYKEPRDPYSFIKSGGMNVAEAVAIAKAVAAATKEARQRVREYWLPTLEMWIDVYEPEGHLRAFLKHEVARLRRCLGPKPSAATVRKQTRERVRRLRARRATNL
jgi:hypothetical protein